MVLDRRTFGSPHSDVTSAVTELDSVKTLSGDDCHWSDSRCSLTCKSRADSRRGTLGDGDGLDSCCFLIFKSRTDFRRDTCGDGVRSERPCFTLKGRADSR